MTISDRFGDVDPHGVVIYVHAAWEEARHLAIVSDVPVAEGLWGGGAWEFCTGGGSSPQVVPRASPMLRQKEPAHG